MIIIGILLGVLALGIFASSIYFLWEDDNEASAFLLSIFACLAILSAITITVSIETSERKTIKCTEIQQIDTLYRNDSIVGYEITVMK